MNNEFKKTELTWGGGEDFYIFITKRADLDEMAWPGEKRVSR